MLRICKKHGEANHTSGGRDGRSRCVKCSYEAVKRRRKKVKILAIEYKGGRCEHCGYSKSIRALEFHHSDGESKDFNISSSVHNKSWSLIAKELDKCVLLCSNCHREEHERLDLEEQ